MNLPVTLKKGSVLTLPMPKVWFLTGNPTNVVSVSAGKDSVTIVASNGGTAALTLSLGSDLTVTLQIQVVS